MSAQSRSPRARLRALVVVAGLLVFGAVMVYTVLLHGGRYSALADATPANFIFVGLMQLALFIWVIAGVIAVWECYKVLPNKRAAKRMC